MDTTPLEVTALASIAANILQGGFTVWREISLRRQVKAETENTGADTMNKIVKNVAEALKVSQEANSAAAQALSELDKIKRDGERSKHIIRQFERDFRSFYDEFNVACWDVDKNGNFLGGNFTFLDLTGLEIEECRTIGWQAAVHEGDAAKVKRLFDKFMTEGETFCELKFNFCHRKTQNLTKVAVHVKAYYEEGAEIYKYTARTKQIKMPA